LADDVGVWVKICGITDPSDAVVAMKAGADAIGVNFHPPSVRYCSVDKALAVRAALPEKFPVYGVFVDRSRDQIQEMLDVGAINCVQLHGSESAAEAEGWPVAVIRAVPAGGPEALREAMAAARRYRLLVDSPSGGGSGQTIAGDALVGIALGEIVLAGGLTPQNVAAKIARYRPFGVDVAGGVESTPGAKSHDKIREFIDHARAT
jgi:phosphoribosylanthranilate isomerase